MRIFRREIEVTLKALGVVTLLALIVVPLAWGYHQGRRARMWQDVVCAYRVNELTRQGTLNLQPEPAPDSCTVLTRLGLALEPDSLAPPTPFVVRRVARGAESKPTLLLARFSIVR
jgi:hypothetical protein